MEAAPRPGWAGTPQPAEMSATAGSVHRFRKVNPCPICGGHADLPRGRGQRCSGYLSSDGRFAYCTREESAGNSPLEDTDPPSFRHILEGECRCGVTHLPSRSAGNELGPIVATYDYVDADGKLIMQVTRHSPKDFRQRRPDGNGGWIKSVKGIKTVLYRLPDVLDAAAIGETVYIVEGEKDVAAVRKAGAWATCNPMGEGQWKAEYAESLKGANVVIVADLDPLTKVVNGVERPHAKGQLHALAIARTIPGATIVQPAAGKDISDHLAAGKTLAELEPFTFQPEQIGVAQEELAAEDEPPRIVTLHHFIHETEETPTALMGEPEETLLPAGGLLILGGEGGATKTTLTLDAIAHICSGTDWLGYPTSRPVRALIIENEGPRSQFRNKLRAKAESWPGDDFHTNVYIWEEPWATFNFSYPQHRQHLIDFTTDRQIDLVVADPLDSLGVEGAGTPENTRTFIGYLKDCGLHDPQRPLAFWILHHYNKVPGGTIIQRLSGAWGGHPDAVLGLELGEGQTTKLTWGKLRHATPPKDKTVILAWDLETRGFTPLEKPPPVDVDELRSTVLEYVTDHPGEAQSSIEDGIGGGRKAIREALHHHLNDSLLLVLGPGRSKNGKYYFPLNHAGLRSPNEVGVTELFNHLETAPETLAKPDWRDSAEEAVETSDTNALRSPNTSAASDGDHADQPSGAGVLASSPSLPKGGERGERKPDGDEPNDEDTERWRTLAELEPEEDSW